MEFTVNALKVLEKRYLKKSEDGKPVERPEDMFWRVAMTIAGVDRIYNETADVLSRAREFYSLMTNMEFMPNSPTLMNAGRELGQLSACFVLPVGDSMDSIFEAVKDTALIHKSGGGTGFSFSQIRPKNDTVLSTKGISSGPISFMKVFDMATETIKQGGTRRGANMGILRVDHPDILEFIVAKEQESQLNNFNISVALTEKFMKALEADGEYELVNPRTGKTVERLKAGKVFDMIVEHAWLNGDPGIIFIDRINASNPTPLVGKMESTNPCGEQPLLPYESCNLGSINLAKMLVKRNSHYEVDFPKLARTARMAVHFLDNVIDINNYPLSKIKEMTLANRKIGLGVMGFADMLIRMGIPYNSEEALKVADEVMSFIQDKSHDESSKIAEARGSFPNYAKSTYANSGKPMRNATVTTIAPTGTISIISGCSSGIEPIFAIAFTRHVLDNDELIEVHPIFRQMAKEQGFFSPQVMKKMAEAGGIGELAEVPADIKKIFVTAHDVSPEWHVQMQAAFQKHTDNAVSKTVNFANTATQADVEKVYRLAYKLECKGVTIFRDGSRSEQVWTKSITRKSDAHVQDGSITPRPRKTVTHGTTEKVVIGCGNLYVTVNSDELGICEVFTSTGRAGGCPSQSEATSRLVSLALRSGISVDALIEQLKGIRCLSTVASKRSNSEIRCLSCPDAIGRAIEKYTKMSNRPVVEEEVNGEVETEKRPEPSVALSKPCPDCGAKIEREGGCIVCRVCGYSKCN
ncbi:MAG: vitamin B12-dependent ribonucleotide reductase [Candidatus Abyssobacteria bacterium SURF_17]|uniref:Vitamin B12-dependent ribonucleotide reductase n=1 Tax=Candidatus Abyssobacteria bacterium SURF_17 TaxID=2093361 RepID=A0A419F673_9BACT|nr:MAG: vitamin B12-dependent ribonucleotide reductase [Candidatus Abyssubacteria bacterium SURF_17]